MLKSGVQSEQRQWWTGQERSTKEGCSKKAILGVLGFRNVSETPRKTCFLAVELS